MMSIADAAGKAVDMPIPRLLCNGHCVLVCQAVLVTHASSHLCFTLEVKYHMAYMHVDLDLW